MEFDEIQLKSIRRSQDGQEISTISNVQPTCLLWSEVTCWVNRLNGTKEVILSHASGGVNSGEMIAVLGPSGAGKSTLLSCLVGTRRPNSGQIKLCGQLKRLKFAYVAQEDELCSYLTVYEYLNFAAKFKLDSTVDKHERINEIIDGFNLQTCLNNLVTKCSGGERRRVSIAVEVLSYPNILILDEPTTGLDSFTANKVVSTVKEMTNIRDPEKRAMVIMTIHQPGSQIFAQFDRVYILSRGQCIYAGLPLEIQSAVDEYQLRIPDYYNPADFILDVAIGNYGEEVIKQLGHRYSKPEYLPLIPNDSKDMSQLRMVRKSDRSLFVALIVNTQKLFLANVRDPQQYLLRLLLYIVLPALFYFLQIYYLNNGCVYDFASPPTTNKSFENVYERLDRKSFVLEGTSSAFFNAFVVFFTSTLPTFISFSDQISAFVSEERNTWYTMTAFFFSWAMVNMVISAAMGIINSVVYFIASHRAFTVSVFFLFIVENTLFSLCCAVIGFLLGIGFNKHLIIGIIVACIIMMGMLVLSGFIVKSVYMVSLIKWASLMNPVKYGFEASVATLYSSPCRPPSDFSFQFRQVVDFITFYIFTSKDESVSSMDNIPPKAEYSLAHYHWNQTTINGYIVKANELDESAFDKLNSFWTNKLNMVYTEFGLRDTDAYDNIGSLIIMLCILHCMAFVGLYIKIRV